ncbi:ribonuclease P protein component [Cellulosimicrobium sp. CUA-896]|uniref:ribonuclease P protein component n=1 Tax=Cellulosimicrobium sp. CUA-896 TaxID=1517881 RepID=UPI00095EA0A0|nr:ribonuclease P protein component [Cellulosimicrobium sp. CUA-896]OLT54441.1 ribonuclease P protein component [Cellulosimicrobium sp. CUA-896]
MLPAAHRLRRSVDFERAVRRGARAGRSTVVVHLAEDDAQRDGVPQVGFVVSKAVGNAVHRNLVKRRLRAATAPRLSSLPANGRVVVRALPASADATYDELSRDLERGLERAVVRWNQRRDGST